MESQKSINLLLSETERLKTFESWPNEVDDNCTPEKLAQAGFYFLPCEESPDNVCCIFCGKELDGWAPDDDPLEEHRKHSKACPFLAMPQPFAIEKLTIKQFVEFMKSVTCLAVENQFNKKTKEFQEYADSVEKALRKHVLG
ncbi:hypothetical protein EGW08_002816 [Elysia chlorotica]|uniref:Uncharacterized protein n=1 Tax=Elysia chlorotica TaxID=188477 RepID=A0A3S0ZXZ1_ELYCH|nr:hypothetical protein EGW08_002816 [Elysia chlorotica]